MAVDGDKMLLHTQCKAVTYDGKRYIGCVKNPDHDGPHVGYWNYEWEDDG